MCEVLQIAKSTFYYETKDEKNEDVLSAAIVEIFHKKRKAYGTLKIKVKLKEQGLVISSRRIG
ncbi:hypothetical protein PAECIP111892_04641 [Paenibacillus auburnensis]|uniref:HTH-like domain-containing protein n=1 Tax=Paenibacillus auburnensis TaxID=2905649 RepID=A0ABM9CMW3_9BACL|nr:hypothetical protein PAECIP111892_04641 [Paenibacillus auburnensis]